MMKFSIFFTLTIIFFATALVSTVIEGYHAEVVRNVIAECKIWITDNNGNYVAGNKHYHRCDNNPPNLDIDTLSNDSYWLIASVEGSGRQNKRRGPFNNDVCYIIYGDAANWHFDTWDYCNSQS
ncbi:unnamed protein product [Rhizophagus irregularis]|nr:unnamed protein product [Rhizophagus irregularis]